MDFDSLAKYLSQYYKKIGDASASTPDWQDIKNKVRQAYDAGSLSQEQYKDLNAKTTFHFKNQGKAYENLQDLPDMVKSKVNIPSELRKASPLAEEASEAGGIISRIPKAGKMLAMLGPLAKTLAIGGGMMGIMGAGQKAMAGDLKGAGLDAADTASNFVPGVGEAKMALGSEGLGKGSDDVSNLKPADMTPYLVNDTKRENPVRYEDMQNEISNNPVLDPLKKKLGVK
jgi:hypothetical protein